VNYAEKDASLLQRFLEGEGYDVSTVTSLSSFDSELDDADRFTLAFVDADGFPPELWERCEQLQTENIPFLVLSLNPEAVVERTGSASTQSIAEKPIQKQQLLGFITSITD
jgi:DNA-binding response OmpR family regulator